MMKILIFHQSADLYGSDKTLLDLIRNLDKDKFTATVLLPCHGPLVSALLETGCEVNIVPLLRASRATFTPKNIFRIPLDAYQSLKAISRVIDHSYIDVVHSNTLAVLSGALWSYLHKKPHLWHVHEIIESPAVVRKAFALFLAAFADVLVCNSHATLQHWSSTRKKLSDRARVIWNGVDRAVPPDVNRSDSFRRQVGIPAEATCVTMVGRINRWKGQGLLINAATLLWNEGLRDVRYLIVGSPPHGQEHLRAELERQIAGSSACESITLLDFQEDIWTVWDASDIAVVPSTDPEPFGLVAIEAMLAGKPVVAAEHGGLIEILKATGGGLLFKPGNAQALADNLRALLQEPERARQLGSQGLQEAKRQFSISEHVAAFEALYAAMVKSRGLQ